MSGKILYCLARLTGETTAILALTATLVLCACSHDRIGDSAATFALPNVRGGEFRYPAPVRRSLLIAFLQTQPDVGSEHNPSRGAVPFLMSMDHQYREAGPGVDVIIIDETALATYPPVAGSNPSIGALLNTSYDWSLTVPLLADPKGKVARLYGVKGVPTLVLIGSDGRIAERWTRVPHPANLAAGIQQLVGGPMAGRPPLADDDPPPAQK